MIAMKFVFILCVLTFLIGCKEAPKESEIPYREGATVLTVKGMYCSSCKGKIMTALSQVEGVEWARAEDELDQVAFTGTAKTSEVVEAIRNVGYEVME